MTWVSDSIWGAIGYLLTIAVVYYVLEQVLVRPHFRGQPKLYGFLFGLAWFIACSCGGFVASAAFLSYLPPHQSVLLMIVLEVLAIFIGIFCGVIAWSAVAKRP
jgi:hypothetical protein